MSFAGATYYSIKNLPQNTANLLSLRHKAITSINDRLSEPNISTDDQTIAAVFCMSILESVYGDTSSYNIHMSGLEKMVRMRGGVESLGLGGLLARMVVWLDFNHSKLHGTPLHFGKSAEVGSRPSPFKHPRRTKSSSFITDPYESARSHDDLVLRLLLPCMSLSEHAFSNTVIQGTPPWEIVEAKSSCRKT